MSRLQVWHAQLSLLSVCERSQQPIQRTTMLTYHAVAEIGVIGYHFDYVSEMPDKVILARKVFSLLT
jgi:hypothetical protein